MLLCRDEWSLSGPVGSECGFRFTLAFGSVILSILPSTIFICLASFRIYRLHLRPSVITGFEDRRSAGLIGLKMIGAAALVLANVLALIAWLLARKEPGLQSAYGVLAFVLAIISAVSLTLVL